MKPLIYLTLRSFVNGIKRALTSPKRLISLLVFGFYYVRVFMFPIGSRQMPNRFPVPDTVALLAPGSEAAHIMDAVIFGVFAVLTMFLSLGIFSYKNTFKPADVDVLFPTPVAPRLVLIFRIVRDYLLTLLLPLLIIFFTFRPAQIGLRTVSDAVQNPAAITSTLRVATGAWLLFAFTWVCIGYAAGLFMNRSDLNSDRNRKIITWTYAVLVLGAIAYVGFSVRGMSNVRELLPLAESPLLRAVFFTSTAATAIIMGAFDGSVVSFALGVGGLGLLAVGALRVALSQVGWMYDQAAARGFDASAMRSLQQKGDTIGAVAELARRGKVKAGKQRWIHRVQLPGAGAIVWKEILIQMRSQLSLFVLFGLIGVAMTLLPLLGAASTERGTAAFFFMMQAFSIFMMTMVISQAGFIEVLRRVDLQKPLPFSSATTILMETLAKAAPAVFSGWLGSFTVFIVRPDLWQVGIASLILVPFFAVLICSVTFLVTILFPDIDDPTQRGFRGLMTLLALVILVSPGGAAFSVSFALGVSPILAAIVAAALNTGITAGVAALSGNQYAAYNPSE